MRFLKYVLALAALVAIAFMVPAKAANIKVPLSKQCYAEMCWYEWTSSAANGLALITADTLVGYVDTATASLTAINPDSWLVEMPFGGRSSLRTFPEQRIPERINVSILAHGGGDTATGRLESWWSGSGTTTDTLWASSRDTASMDFLSIRKQRFKAAFGFEPRRFFAPKVRVTSATDTLFVKTLRAYPSED